MEYTRGQPGKRYNVWKFLAERVFPTIKALLITKKNKCLPIAAVRNFDLKILAVEFEINRLETIFTGHWPIGRYFRPALFKWLFYSFQDNECSILITKLCQVSCHYILSKYLYLKKKHLYFIKIQQTSYIYLLWDIRLCRLHIVIVIGVLLWINLFIFMKRLCSLNKHILIWNWTWTELLLE